jgi:Tfp pilus assembly protein PilO
MSAAAEKDRGSLAGYGGQGAFAGVAFALALATALLVAGGSWAWKEWSRQWESYGTYRDLQRNAGRADSLSRAYESLGSDLDALRRALPADNQASHLRNLLVEEARKRGLGIAGITALDEIPFPGYTELPFEVALSGNFPALVRYFHSLETRGLAVQLRRVGIRNEKLNKAHVQVCLDLSVFAPHEAPQKAPRGTP